MGNAILYKSGDKYSGLMLTGKAYVDGKGHNTVEYICVCGKITWVRLSSLVSKNTKSCGCLRGLLIGESSIRHGIYNHRLYWIWHGIKQRCYNKNKGEFEDYGGRGIFMCDEWLNSVVVFYNWAIENGWRPGLTIERINNDGHYSPYNCVLVTMHEQSRNRRGNVILTAFGETKCATDWANDSRCKIGKDGLWGRIRSGWDAEKAVTTPSINITRKKSYKLINTK